MRSLRCLSDMDRGHSVPDVLGHGGASLSEDAVLFVGDER